MLNVLFDTLQWSVATRDCAIRRRPEVVSTQFVGHFRKLCGSKLPSRDALERIDQRRQRYFRRVSDQQTNVVRFEVRFPQFALEIHAYLFPCVSEHAENAFGDDLAPILRNKDQMNAEIENYVSS